MIKYIIIFFICLSSCKEKQKDISGRNNLPEDSSSFFKDSTNIDEVKVTAKLPYGSEKVYSYSFPDKWSYPSVFSDNDSIDKNTEILNLIVDSLQRGKSLKMTLSLRGLDDQGKYEKELSNFLQSNSLSVEYGIAEILPKRNSCNILIRAYENLKKGVYVKDMVTVDETGKVIDYLNIYYSLSKDLHSSEKVFYIDEDYKIHIKSFEVYDNETRMIQNVVYNITEDGEFGSMD